MKKRACLKLFVFIVFAGLTVSIPFLSPQTSGAYAQQGNSISGLVFGQSREPISDIPVELMNEFSQTIAHTRTNGSGRYVFHQLPQGRYMVRVLPYGTDYDQQEQSVEIYNFTTRDGQGNVRRSGFSNEQLDFTLRMSRRALTGMTGAVFVQEVPEKAKKLYQKGISELDDKKEKEGLQSIKAAIETFPEYYAAYEKLGTEYVRLQYFEAAQILLTKAVQINPRGYRSWYGLAYSHYSLNNFDEALKATQKAVELAPNSVESLLLSGLLLRKNKRFEEAEKNLLKANELAKASNPQVHWQLALLYGNDLKRYGEAAKALKLFLKTQPETKDAETIKKLIEDFERKAANG
jgi:tetratricopeptide (TPR) repeat protein